MILIMSVIILGYILNFIPMGGLISIVLNLGLFTFWILGLISAINGEEKPLPIVGDMFQKWFAGFAL